MNTSFVYLFDIDGTLLATGGAGRLALELALQSEFGVAREIPSGEMSGRTDRGIIQSQFAAHGIEETEENVKRFIDAYLDQLPACLHVRQGEVLPGVAQLLETLSQAGAPVGLLTGNLKQGAQSKLGHHGLMDYFPFGAFGDHHLTRDELAHHAFQIVTEHLEREIPPADIWIIGDTPLDISCARAIGANVVAVTTGGHPRDELDDLKPDLLVDDLSDFAALETIWGT